jgi:hypothetical protein
METAKQAQERVANEAKIELQKVQNLIDRFSNVKDPNWADVGELGRIVTLLKHITLSDE